jgi:hypothetical protein
MEQTISRSMTVGDSYQASVWVSSAPKGSSVSGRFVIWGLGGSGNEAAVRNFTATSTWSEVTVNLDQAMRTHSQLRVQVYIDTPGKHLHLDDVHLEQGPTQPARTAVPIQSPSFENGATGWGFGNGLMNRSVATGAAQSGTHYLAANTKELGRSIAQQIDWPVPRASAYTATVWVKTQRDKPFSGKLALWSLGGKSMVATTPFVAGSSWQQVSVSISATEAAATHMKLEIYLGTLDPQTLLIDNVSLNANLLSNGSLESGGSGWSIHESGTNFVTYSSSQIGSPAPIDGSHVGAFNTPVANGSIQTDLPRTLRAQETYTATLWLRSSDPARSFTGTLALWEIGPGGNSAGSTAVSVSGQWKQYTVKVAVAHNASTTLRLQLYGTAGAPTVFFDGATLH